MTLSATAQAEAIKQHAIDPFLTRLTITHADLETPIRLVRNREQVILSDGTAFSPFPFKCNWPNDDEQQPSARISISNVSRNIGKALEAIVTPATFKMEIALASDPDNAEMTIDELTMTQAQWNAFVVTLTIQKLAYWDEPYPKKRVTPTGYPGLVP